jgi:hypothetical protein
VRRINDAQPAAAPRRTALEVRLLAVLSWREQPIEELAALIGQAPGQRVSKVLWALRDAGVALRGERGWRLAQL